MSIAFRKQSEHYQKSAGYEKPENWVHSEGVNDRTVLATGFFQASAGGEEASLLLHAAARVKCASRTRYSLLGASFVLHQLFLPFYTPSNQSSIFGETKALLHYLFLYLLGFLLEPPSNRIAGLISLRQRYDIAAQWCGNTKEG